MAEKSSFFNARLNGTTYDRVYKAEDFAKYFSTFVGNGVFANPTNNLQVVAKSGMTVILKKGKSFINGYFYENTEDLEITLDLANGTLKRIDRIVLRLDYLNREIKAYVLKGTPSSSAAATSITRNSDIYEVALCDITVNSGATEITQSNISDTRYNNSICGIVKGLVDEINTTDLFNQFTTTFNELKEEEKIQFENWFNNLKNQLDSNQATNLQNQITTLKTNYDDFRTNGGKFACATIKDVGSFAIQSDKGKGVILSTKYDDLEGNEKEVALLLNVDNGNMPVLRPTGASGGGSIGIGTESLPFKNLITSNGISATKENTQFQDYFYFNVEPNSSTGAYNGTIGLKHYDSTINDTSYMGLNFNKTATTINEITPFVNNSTSLGSSLKSFKDIYLSGVNKAPNGYTKLPNGFVLQWGTVTTVNMNNSNRNCQKIINYPYTFPNYVCCAMAQCVANNTDGGSANYISDINSNMHSNSTSQAVIDIEILGSLDSYTLAFDITWFALGY